MLLYHRPLERGAQGLPPTSAMEDQEPPSLLEQMFADHEATKAKATKARATEEKKSTQTFGKGLKKGFLFGDNPAPKKVRV